MTLGEKELAILAEAKRRRLDKTTALERWCPQVPTAKQQQFLACNGFEALFGGSAGPGKSSALLMAALEHVDKPGYAALLLRRTYADLALPGAIMDRSHEWLGGTAATWNGTDKVWTFPSGARIAFGYLDVDKDKYRYQSSEFQCLCFDELTQFPETSYRYLLSRVRRNTNNDVPLRVRAASNPGGIGHDWVYSRFVDPASNMGREFVPALLSDNPHIDATEYRKALAQLDETTRRQLEEGLWIRDSQGLVYQFAPQRNATEAIPDADWSHVLGVDFGASEAKPTTAFATVAYNINHPTVYLVHCSKAAALTVTDIAARMHALNATYRYSCMVADQGALGKGYIEELRRRHSLPVRAAQKQDKLGFRKLLNADLQRGVLQVVEHQCSDWIDEATSLVWDKDGQDDDGTKPNHATDAALYAWREAKHFLYRAKEPQPVVGSAAHYDKQAREYERRLVNHIQQVRDNAQAGVW